MLTNKPIIVAIVLLCLAGAKAEGQAAFNTMDSININKINASVLVHGDMWWNPTLEVAHCNFPMGSPASINFVSTLWMSGYDAGNYLHVAAQTYRQTGNDYWPGPIDGTGAVAYSDCYHWAKIWKLNRTDIQYFQSLGSHTISNTPAAILTWPAKGNTNARGNAGSPLTITTDMAPFVDLNGNGIYEPLLGEYPDVKGDQAAWWVLNDNGPAHGETRGTPLGVEIHAMAYAYSRGTLIDNVVYYEYYITNKSANNYHNFRLAQWDDVDLGWFQDDFIGFDSTWRMGICYNGIADDGRDAGHPANSYGTSVPVVGVTMIVLPGDAGTAYVPVGNFDYYENDFTAVGNPTVDTEYNNYIRGKDRGGAHFTNDYAGPGIPSTALGTGPNTNYVYSGDPASTTQWSECAAGNRPGDRRFLLASNDFDLSAGSVQKIVLALVTTDTGAGQACPDAGFGKIKIVADTAWKDYFNPPPPLPASTINILLAANLKIYPNPAHDNLYIESTDNSAGDETITIYNAIGIAMNTVFTKNGNMWEGDIKLLPAGLYDMVYRSGSMQASAKFVKE